MTARLIEGVKRWLRWPASRKAQVRPQIFADQDIDGLTIGFLADDVQDFEVFARWLYTEWSEPRGESLSARKRMLSKQLNTSHLPVALVAYWQGQPAGIVSLRVKDLHTRPRLSPWLSALYVDDRFRGKGIGRALVHATEELARGLGYGHLHLFTADRQSFYMELGWTCLPRLPEEALHQPPNDVFRQRLG